MCPSVYSVQGSIQWDVWKQAHGARCPEDCSIYTSKCDSDPRSVQIPQQPPLFRCWDPRWAVEFNDRRSAVAWHLYFYQIIDKAKHVIFSVWKIAMMYDLYMNYQNLLHWGYHMYCILFSSRTHAGNWCSEWSF